MNESQKIVEKVIRVLRQAQHEGKFINDLCSAPFAPSSGSERALGGSKGEQTVFQQFVRR